MAHSSKPCRALVLAGGGARGSYQIGVWRALAELGWRPDIITGTSVGCLNGAMLALDMYETARDMWLTIRSRDVMELPEPASGLSELHEFLRAFGHIRGCAYAVESGEASAMQAAGLRRKFDALQQAAAARYPATISSQLKLALSRCADKELAPLEAAARAAGVDPARYYTVHTLGQAFLAKCDIARAESFAPLLDGSATAAQAALAAVQPGAFLQALVYRALCAAQPAVAGSSQTKPADTKNLSS